MPDTLNPRLAAAVLVLAYALVTVGALVGQPQDDRIGGLLFVFVLLAGLGTAAAMRFRPRPMAVLLWILSAAQAGVMIALLAAGVGNAGVVAFLNVTLVAGMVFVAVLFGRARGLREPS